MSRIIFIILSMLLILLNLSDAIGQDNKAFKSTVIANNDFITMQQGEESKINVLQNDFGLEEGVASLTVADEATHGTTEVTTDNQILYIPNKEFSGKDQFTYEVCNTSGSCDEARVSIEVSYVNYIPEANNDTAQMYTGQLLNIDILSNDNNLYDVPLLVEIITPLNNGYATINSDHTLTPSFDIGYLGLDSLQYEVCDIDGDCDDAWVFIDVQKEDGYEIFIPQGISPNGDGLNDLFYIPDFAGLEMSLQIRNSLGELVYVESNYQNNWDGIANKGKDKGQVLRNGTYYYSIQLMETKQVYTGFIYLNK